jgi:S-adenosylmethionine hydrolase
VEVALNQGSFAKEYGVKIEDNITIEKKWKK